MTSTRIRSVTPHLFVLDPAAASDFYQRAFGAVELFRNALPGGQIMFLELALGDARLLLSQETPTLGAFAPASFGGSPVQLHIEVPDADATYAQALAAGAEVEIELQDMFWGERYGVVNDPFGHRWSISTADEDFTPDDIASNTPPDIAD